MVMTDVTGKVVFETPLSNKNEIDLSHTAKGMYILKFYNRDTLLT
jgi:hypothetical protein